MKAAVNGILRVIQQLGSVVYLSVQSVQTFQKTRNLRLLC